MKPYILSCDLETTGLSPSNNDWITGSFAVLDFNSLKCVRELDLKSRPNVWCEEAFKTHKIRKEIAMTFPDRVSVLKELISFIPPRGDFYFLCHANTNQFGQHVHFDFACLKMDFFTEFSMFEFRKYFNDQDCISTHTMAQELQREKVLPKDVELTLEGLCSYFKVPYGKHDARFDRISMEAIYARLRSLYGSLGERNPDLDPGIFEVSRPFGSEDQQRFSL